MAHHLMTETPEKRWRRDHEMMLNLCADCHFELHLHGNEAVWCATNEFDGVDSAIYNRTWGKRQGYL